MDTAGTGNRRPVSDFYGRTDHLTRTDLWAWREAKQRLAPSSEARPPAHRDAQPASDPTPEIAARPRDRFEPLEADVAASRHTVVRTDQAAAGIVEDAAMPDRQLGEPATATPLDAKQGSL
jgi:hypothetical protein